jgi:uncharacterized protein (UPF0335 family)
MSDQNDLKNQTDHLIILLDQVYELRQKVLDIYLDAKNSGYDVANIKRLIKNASELWAMKK